MLFLAMTTKQPPKVPEWYTFIAKPKAWPFIAQLKRLSPKALFPPIGGTKGGSLLSLQKIEVKAQCITLLPGIKPSVIILYCDVLFAKMRLI